MSTFGLRLTVLLLLLLVVQEMPQAWAQRLRSELVNVLRFVARSCQEASQTTLNLRPFLLSWYRRSPHSTTTDSVQKLVSSAYHDHCTTRGLWQVRRPEILHAHPAAPASPHRWGLREHVPNAKSACVPARQQVHLAAHEDVLLLAIREDDPQPRTLGGVCKNGSRHLQHRGDASPPCHHPEVCPTVRVVGGPVEKPRALHQHLSALAWPQAHQEAAKAAGVLALRLRRVALDKELEVASGVGEGYGRVALVERDGLAALVRKLLPHLQAGGQGRAQGGHVAGQVEHQQPAVTRHRRAGPQRVLVVPPRGPRL
mmetsp:Transcript_65404/g.185652  ORF Transcript_65404/g.185652 Transcript_65404/m.185652 type:complete len:313 (-) Transcript_65404:44-982(-)